MPIPDADLAYLAERSLAHYISQDSGMTCIMFPQWPLPPGYDRSAAEGRSCDRGNRVLPGPDLAALVASLPAGPVAVRHRRPRKLHRAHWA